MIFRVKDIFLILVFRRPLVLLTQEAFSSHEVVMNKNILDFLLIILSKEFFESGYTPLFNHLFLLRAVGYRRLDNGF